MVKISPSILAGDFLHLKKEVDRLEKSGVDSIHFDIMDGVYIPNITFGFKFLSSIKKATFLSTEVHLMIIEPLKYIKNFADAGADIMIFFYEATKSRAKIIDEIKKYKCKAGISINPSTPVKVLKNIISCLDVVLLLSVEPGFCGQQFIESSYQKIKELKKMILTENCETLIEVDGGVGLNNYKRLIDIGTDVFVIGNDFFKQNDFKKYVKTMKEYKK